MDKYVVPIVAALLGGGFLAGAGQVISALTNRRTAMLQEPGMITSSSLGGAEQAIALMERALSRAEREVEALKTERDDERRRSKEKDRRISELEQELIKLRTQLSALSERLNITVNRVQEIKDEDT